jgi:signal transduction histidine kinase
MVRTWLVFIGALLVVLAALGWMTTRALESSDRAVYEESVRLALWRLESALSPMILQESARPHSTYAAYLSPLPASSDDENVLTPSPLLTEEVEHTLLHFELTERGIRSPQVPTRPRPNILPAGLLRRERHLDRDVERLSTLKRLLSIKEFDACVTSVGCDSVEPPKKQESVQSQVPSQALQIIDPSSTQFFRNTVEFTARQNFNRQVQLSNTIAVHDDAEFWSVDDDADRLLVSGMQAFWFKDELFLARRVRNGSSASIQSCWVDWKSLTNSVLPEIQNLFPAADLVPVENEQTGESSRRLASFPLGLVPGALAEGIQTTAPETWLPLAIAWFCVGIFAIATAFLLNGAVSLSERRGAFVSAVTHELRTPLTTFQLYTEMLSSGMVRDEDKRRQYLATLSTEANRLGHMVENVLSYARLENGNSTRSLEEINAIHLIERVQERVTEKARQGGMSMHIRASDLESTRVLVNISTVEQILLNLVDNACKYATDCSSEPLELTALAKDGQLRIALQDTGPGIKRENLSRLFRPFSKSAHDAADSAPGIGLGLALSRRLARDLGGDLLYVDCPDEPGACFELRLPLAPDKLRSQSNSK